MTFARKKGTRSIYKGNRYKRKRKAPLRNLAVKVARGMNGGMESMPPQAQVDEEGNAVASQ